MFGRPQIEHNATITLPRETPIPTLASPATERQRTNEKLFVDLFAAFLLLPSLSEAADKFHVQVVETSGSITTSSLGVSTDATAKVIMPNGDHADLLCSGKDGHCAKISPLSPEKMRPDATACSTVGDTSICVTHDLGEYVASREGNDLTIEAPNGKLRFKIVGSW